MSNLPPIEVPQGAIRLNTDSQRLEFFAQDRWYEMATNTPNLDGGARGLFMGIAGTPATENTIQFITISTQGNAIDFGDLQNLKSQGGSCGSSTRGISAGGEAPALRNEIEFVTFSSTGDSTDFGDLTRVKRRLQAGALSNATRGCFNGGYTTSPSNTSLSEIDFITMASAGDAKDFGDLTKAREFNGSFASPTRGLVVGGRSQSPSPNTFQTGTDFYTIASTGNAQEFEESTSLAFMAMSFANSTRGVIGGGLTPTSQSAITFVTIASLGEFTNFGELRTTNRDSLGTFCDSTRGIVGGGGTPGNTGPTYGSQGIDYINIATGGTSVDFGNLLRAQNFDSSGCSNGHGGL